MTSPDYPIRGPLDEPWELWAETLGAASSTSLDRLALLRCTGGQGRCKAIVGIVFLVPGRGRLLAVRIGERLPNSLLAGSRPQMKSIAGSLDTVHSATYEWLDEGGGIQADEAFCHNHGQVLFDHDAVCSGSARVRTERTPKPRSVPAHPL